jgi:hypothetical protein
MMVAFALVFGFFGGSNVSLAPVCIGQNSEDEHVESSQPIGIEPRHPSTKHSSGIYQG